MLLRYFESKAGLFEAALRGTMRLDPVLAEGRERFGAHLADLLLRDDLDVNPPVLIALSSGDPVAVEITARVTEEQLIRPLAEWLGGPDARARAVEITMLATGFVIYARQLPMLPGQRLEPGLQGWFAGAVQALVDGAPG